jgi:hypothetical protein
MELCQEAEGFDFNQVKLAWSRRGELQSSSLGQVLENERPGAFENESEAASAERKNVWCLHTGKPDGQDGDLQVTVLGVAGIGVP